MTLFTPWQVSFALGFAAILFFAQDRLEHPLKTDGADRLRRERLFDFVRPYQLRNRDAFRKAYVMYTATLVMVYAAGAVFGSILGPFLFPTADVNGPEWPLALALAMIGIAPKFPFLVRLEEWVRARTHEAVGVPRTFHAFTDALAQVQLDRDSLTADLIGPGDAERLTAVLDAARRVFGARTSVLDTFSNRVMKLYAFRAWADSAPAWPPATVRREFGRLEAEVTPPVFGLIEDLQHLAAVAMPDAGAERDAREALESRWRAIARRVAETADDVCALFALYAERSSDPPVKDNPISALLRDLIEQAQAEREADTPVADALLAAVGIVAAVAFLTGLAGALSGITALPGVSPLTVAFFYFMGVVVLYGPSGFLAWNARRDRRWVNAFAGDRVFPAMQYLSLCLRGFGLSFLMMALFMVLNLAAAHLAQRGAGGEAVHSVVVRQFLGLGSTITCGQNAMVLVALAAAPLGAWNAVHLALQADLAALGREHTARARGLVVLHAGGLGAIHFVATAWLGRMVPCTDAPATVAPLLGLPLNAAQEVVAFEVITSVLLGLVFAWQTRAALVTLRDSQTTAARVPLPAARG